MLMVFELRRKKNAMSRNIHHNMCIKRPGIALFSLVMLCLLVLLAACGSNGSSATGSSATATSAPTATPTTAPTPTPTSAPTPTPTAVVTGPTQTVNMVSTGGYSFAFSPDKLTIHVGTTIVWLNRTTTSHTVTSDDGKSFDSGADAIASGGTYMFKFTKAGTYSYHCSFHSDMVATIVVN